MQTGLLDGGSAVDGQIESMLNTSAALLRCFAKDATLVAARYANGNGRCEVTALDMHKSLKYVARTFFQQEEGTLQARVQEEVARMESEESDEDDGEEDEEEDEEEDGEDDEYYDDGEEDGGEEDGGEEDGSHREKKDPPSPRDVQLVRCVDQIVATWPLYKPNCNLSQLLKRAIDNTPIE